MKTDFNSRLSVLRENHKKLITRKNEKIEPGNGIFLRYKFPVLTGDHAPLFWKYDLNPETNPHLMERFGIHAAFNAGAMKFEGKYIRYRAPRQMYVLDPRYPEVRKFLVSTYANFLSQWKFDGYWFDFLKGFYPKEGAVVDEDKGRDFASIELAVDTLYSDMEARLKAINPKIFLGQKFPIVGPNLISY